MLRRWIATLLPKFTKIEVVKRSSTTLSLAEWRSEKALIGSAVKIWNDPDFQLMMQVLENEHPAWSMLNPTVSRDIRADRQALIEGYTLAISNLKAMRVFREKVELAAPSYEEEELQTQP